MNWEAIGAVGEVGGAIAVVATLLYLSRQIRESNRVSRAEAVRSRGERMVDVWFRVAENDRLFSGVTSAIFEQREFEELPADEQVALRMVMRGLTARWEAEYFENHHGVLEDEVWTRRLDTLVNVVSLPAVYQCWCENRSALTQGFVVAVDEALAARGISLERP